jgi:SAM-dependent methyltransferase
MLKEKRLYPRIKTGLKVDISRNISAELIDLSEGGVRFGSKDTIVSPTVSLQIHFPGRKSILKSKAKFVWRRDYEEKGSVYGVEFVSLSERQKRVLRKELIKTQIEGLITEIGNPELKEIVYRFFLKDILNYTSEIIKLISNLSENGEYSQELEKKIECLNNHILLKGYCLELLLSNEEIISKIKDNLRKLIGVWIYKSEIVKYAFYKAGGYPEDYKILEFIYNNKPVSEAIGVYFDNNFLKSPYAVALRLRKDYLKELLQHYISETTDARIYILNITCGCCREIYELLKGFSIKREVTFTCVDGDREALEYSRSSLNDFVSKNIEVRFINEDIKGIIENNTFKQLYGKQNFIYSLGVLDYLSDRTLQNLVATLYQLLKRGGKLILTHKNKDKTFPPLTPDWFCNWKCVPRNRDEVFRLLYDCHLHQGLISVKSDNFGYIYYFIIEKK